MESGDKNKTLNPVEDPLGRETFEPMKELYQKDT